MLRDGQLLHDALRASRLAESEVRQAVRSSGSGDLSQVGAVVLEGDGTLGVITDGQMGDGSALGDLR